MLKNDLFQEGGKEGGGEATPIKFLQFESFDMESLLLKYGNDTFTLNSFKIESPWR